MNLGITWGGIGTGGLIYLGLAVVWIAWTHFAHRRK